MREGVQGLCPKQQTPPIYPKSFVLTMLKFLKKIFALDAFPNQPQDLWWCSPFWLSWARYKWCFNPLNRKTVLFRCWPRSWCVFQLAWMPMWTCTHVPLNTTWPDHMVILLMAIYIMPRQHQNATPNPTQTKLQTPHGSQRHPHLHLKGYRRIYGMDTF